MGSLGSLSYNKKIVVDTKGPDILAVDSSTPNGSYKVGDTIKIIINFDEIVYVSGMPSILLDTDSTANNMASGIFSSGSGTSNLQFDYTIQSDHNTDDLNYNGNNALKLNGGSMRYC